MPHAQPRAGASQPEAQAEPSGDPTGPAPADTDARAEREPAASKPAAPDPAVRKRVAALVREANHKLAGGYYKEALALFQQAYELYPSPKLLFNMAQTLNELARPLEALEHYERFVAQVTEEEAEERWRIAHQTVFELQGKIATLELQVNVPGADVTVHGEALGKTPLREAIRLDPGAHTIVVSKTGYERKVLTLRLEPGQNATERLRLLTEEEAAATQRVVQQAEAKRRAAQARLRAEQEEYRQRRETLREGLQISGWTSLGLGLAGGAVAGIFGLLSASEADAVESAGPEDTWVGEIADHHERAETYRTTAYWAVGVGGVLTVAGAVLTGVGYSISVPERGSPKSEGQPATSAQLLPAMGPERAGLLLRVAF